MFNRLSTYRRNFQRILLQNQISNSTIQKGEKFKSHKVPIKISNRRNFQRLSLIIIKNKKKRKKKKEIIEIKPSRRTSPADFGAPSPLTMFSRRSALRMGLYLGWRSRGWRGTQLRLYTSTILSRAVPPLQPPPPSRTTAL